MNKKISADDFHDAIERQLSGLEPDPWLAQRIIASDKEEVKVKKISHATVIIVAIIVLAMATALAAGLGGRVNWLAHFYELLDYSKDRELIVLSTAHEGIFSSRIQQIRNIDDFKTLMDTAAPDFPLPAEIPEGYVLDKCSVEFGCLPQGEYTLTSQTVHPEDFTESHYVVDPSMDFVKGYSIILKSEDEKDYISILVYMNSSTNPKEYTFGITEDQSARVVQVAGMENALIIDSENTSLLAMRKVMSSPQDDLQFTGPEMEPMIETYNEYRIEVRTPLLPENELVRVFVK